MVRCPQRFSCVVERAFVFCLLEFPQTGFLVKALCPLCQVEAWNVTAVTSHTPVENIWCLEEELIYKYCWTTLVICIYLEGKRLNRADVFCIVAQHPGQTHLERGKITSSGVLHILLQHLTFFSSASCCSVNACSPEFSYQNLCPNQTMSNWVIL